MMKTKLQKICTLIVCAFFIIQSSTHATGEQIKWFVLSGGGGLGTSTNYKVNGTAGQTGAIAGTSTNYKVYGGYWQTFVTSCCVLRGNVNNTGGVTVTDLTYLVSFLFNSGPTPPCLDQANVNGVGGVSVTDLTYLVSFLFNGGAAPPAC